MTDISNQSTDASLQDKAREQLGAAREVASRTLHDTRDKAQHAFEQSRDTARDAARRTAESLDSNPLAVLVGGAALGVLAAAFIPKSDKERELLAPVGKRLSQTAAAAIAAAKENAQNELSSRGLTKDGARDQAKSLLEGLTKAATTAGSAAADAARGAVSRDGAKGGEQA